MNRFIFLVFFFVTSISFSQKNFYLTPPKVDERVELLSIVFRLADCNEYSSKRFKLYTDKIDTHFSAYKNHELIQFIQQIRE